MHRGTLVIPGSVDVVMPHGAPVFVGPAWKLAAGGVFFAQLALACASDVRTRRIPNRLVAVLAVTGLVFSTLATPGLHGLWLGTAGLLVGLAIWLPSWLLRLLGAGDVKFFAAAGAWLGPRGAFEGAVLAAFAGGVLALYWMLRYRGLRGSAVTLWLAGVQPTTLVRPGGTDGVTTPALPYTVALAVGAGLAAWYPRLLF